MAPDYSASSSRQTETARSDALPLETDAASDLVLVRPSRTGTWNSTSFEDTGAVDSLPNNSIRISPQVVSRWADHVMTLSAEQRRMFLRSDPRDDIATYTKAVEGIIGDKLKTSKIVRGTKWVEPLVSFLDMCRPMVDALSGLYPPAGLILGGVFLALSVTKRVVKYQEALVQFLMKVTSIMGQLNKFRTTFPDSTEIHTGLVDIFDIVLQTCAQASSLFFDNKGKEKSTTRLFWRSFEKDFGEWKQSLDVSLETFDRTVQLVSGQRLGDLHGGQMMALRMQLETYKEIRRSESKRLQEIRERQARQLQQEQATTLDETGLWILQHDDYISWKNKSREALLWVNGKHGSGKSHLAARVIEELRSLCQERNAETGKSNENGRGGGSTVPRIADTEGDVIAGSAEVESALYLWHEGTVPTNSSDNNAWNSLAEVADQRLTTSKVHMQPATTRTALAYVYCSFQQVQSSERLRAGRSTEPADCYDSTGLLSCILKQLYQFLPREMDVRELTQACSETREDRPSREAIIDGIRNIIPMFSQSFIVVDGLDECNGMSSLEFETFCNFLASLTGISMTGPSANVLIFSRPGYQPITNSTDGCPRIEVDKGANEKDISRFIDDRSEHLTKDFASLKEIQGHLLDSADGMFLWVSLVIDSIKQERTAKKMKVAARNMPRGLHGAYIDAMRRIVAAEPSIKDLALKALLWTTNAKKPLSRVQLLEALAIEEGMTSIGEDEKLDDDVPLTKDCADLLVLKDGQYMLLHPSLGDFLRDLGDKGVEGLEAYQDLQSNAAHILGVDCLSYLNFDAFRTGPLPTEAALKAMFERHPFLEYAAVFWGDHLREALDRHSQSLEDDTYGLLESQQRRDLIHQVYMRFSNQRDDTFSIFPFPSGTLPLHILSIFGLHHLLGRYRITEVDIDEADGFGNCPLDYASQNGHKDMSSKIVEEHKSRIQGARGKVHLQCKSKSWLIGTIIRQHWTDILIILLDLGHSIHRPLAMLAPTALHLASDRGYTDMMERLLDSGANLDARDYNGDTPLMVAARSNHLAATHILLDHGANAFYCNHSGFTPMHFAAGLPNGKVEMAAILLEAGGRIEAKAQEGETPLHRAAAFGSESMISFLLERGANKDAVTHARNCTPLLIAVMRDRRDAVRLLLNRGASIQIVSSWGRTALHDAAAVGSLDIISQILTIPDGKTLLDWRDNQGLTALSAAASVGSMDSIKRLLDEGADVESATNSGMTPLLIALNQGHTYIARILVEVYKANPHNTDRKRWSAMHHSALKGSPEDVQMLLSWGVEAFARDEIGRTPLHYAVSANNAKFVECYVKNFAPKSVLLPISTTVSLEIIQCLTKWKPELCLWKFENGDLAIHRAVALGNIELVNHLCQPEAISEPDGNGRTPLHYAISARDLKMVQYLLQRGVDVDGLKSSRHSPLIEALWKKHYEIAGILLDWKANVDAKGLKNWRPLHFVALQGHRELTRRLIDAGCELEPRNDKGNTPLFLACSKSHREVIDLFFARGVEDINIQCSEGLTYAHIAAYKGLHKLLEKLLKMNANFINQLDWNGLDPLCVAAYGVEPAAVELLLAYGASPDGPSYTQMTPLGLAAIRGALIVVETLLSAGARVDKMGALLRTPLMLAVYHGHARVAQHLLKAGANPFLQDELGFSSFDLAVGQPAMRAILDPWNRPLGGLSGDNLHQDDHQIHILLRFISRTARVKARKIEQGVPARVKTSFYFQEISLDYFDALADALFSFIRFHEAGRVPIPKWVRMRGLMGSCLHARHGNNLASVPVKRNELFSEFRLLISDYDGSATCDFCCARLHLDYYVCLICPDQCACPQCQHAIAVLPLEERAEDFRRLERLRNEVFAVRRALRPICYRGPRAMTKILSHGPCLRNWVFQKTEDYRKWRSSRKVYEHFQPADIAGWKIVDTIKSILCQSAGPASVGSDTDNAEAAQSDHATSEWNQLTNEWLDIFADHGRVEATRDICDHPYQMYLKKPRLDVDAVHDSSGSLTADFFHFLADKYEEAMGVRTDVMDFLESKRFDTEGAQDAAQGWVRSTTARGDLNQPQEQATAVIYADDIDYSVSSGVTSSSEDSLGDDEGDDEKYDEGHDEGDEERAEIDVEGFLESLLTRRNSLLKDGRLTEEEDLTLNTAWNMAQAIVYQGTPRPSLKDIVVRGEDYCTAPTTPLPSDSDVHGDNAASRYGTPRSMSPASCV